MAVSAVNSQFLYREIHSRDQLQSICNSGSYCVSVVNGVGLWSSSESAIRSGGKKWKRDVKVEAAFWQNIEKPKFVEMEPITDMEQLDQILLQAQQLSQPIVIDWMASWCRKCIYLKPKLEKLAAEYHTRLKFYCVDVNNVPQALVKRGNISKMPTIQLWKDGEMKEEVIGGHKAWLVIDEVRAMIQKYV